MMEYLNLATTLVAFCSAICALTPTPKDDAIIAKVYKVLGDVCAEYRQS